MSIVEKITKSMDVRAVLEELNFSSIKSAGSELKACCGIHGGDNPTAFSINSRTGIWYCHTGCMTGGDIFDVIMQVEEIGFKQAVIWLANLQGITNIDWSTEEIDENYFRDEAKKFIELMMKKANKKELPSWEPRGMTFEPISEYRGYSPETIAHFGFQLCTGGDLEDRIYIPMEDVDGRQVGATGRATKDTQESKFFHRPRSLNTGYFLTGLGRNLEYIREAGNTVKIVEGIFDCARWWDNGYRNVAAPIGLFFTDEHVDQLFKAGVTTIELGFDGDKAGRNGIRKAIKKAQWKFEIYVLDYPDGKDADECTPEELSQVDTNKLTVYEWYDKYGKDIEK
ncbi:DNA primase [Streptococcus pneumoniae]|nr:DNA primase [Streptococcus pneumoniae]